MAEVIATLAETEWTKRTFATYRIRLGAVDPDEISRILGVEPSQAWRAGQEYAGRIRDKATATWVPVVRRKPWGMWFLGTENENLPNKVSEHVAHLLTRVETFAANLPLVRDLLEPDAISFYIRWEGVIAGGSYNLDSRLVGRMARLSDHISFSYIGDCGEDDHVRPSQSGKSVDSGDESEA